MPLGLEQKKDGAMVFKYSMMAAYYYLGEVGSAPGQLKLGDCYANGIGTPKNEMLAIKFYSLATNSSCEKMEACMRLGFLYAREGPLKDEKVAFAYFQRAAEVDNSGEGKYQL